ncbi:MAG: ferrochelatase, partial [Anaerolineae bacterium]
YAVLVTAYGGPDSLEDIEPYLLNIRGGRPTPPALVEEVKERYRLIGGRSPLPEITRAQAQALEARLRAHGEDCRVYVGMRHWHPYIREAVGHIVQDGVRQVVALCLAPHYSRMSIGAYFQEVREAQRELGVDLDVTYVKSWNDHPLLLQAIAEKVEMGLAHFPEDVRDQVQVLFTAHSLPARILDQGDPYDAELRETVRGVVALLSRVPRWRFCYQSAGRSNEPWLGPQIEEVVMELAEAGHKYILVAPIGFVADQVEVLYDIDIACRKMAADRGAWLERTESLNTSPTFIEALASIVREQVNR